MGSLALTARVDSERDSKLEKLPQNQPDQEEY